LTILFADLVGSTELSQRLDAEDLRDLIRAYQDSSKAAIERFDGYVAQYLGDGIVVYFGYPHSHEDDVERAIRAGLELIDAVAEIDASFGRAMDVDIEVRVGVEAGPVIVGDIIGEGASRERAVIGETPNLAARLQNLAEPGQVVIGPNAKSLLGGNVQLRDLGRREIKGYAEPMNVWSVLGLGFAGGRFEKYRDRQLSNFVGRGDELDRLVAAFERTKAGENVLVQIVGEAGIGKSRLVHEYLNRRSSTTRSLIGYCASYNNATAFFPFIDMFRRVLDLDDSDSLQWDISRIEAVLSRGGLSRGQEVPYVLNLLGLAGAQAIDPDLIGVQTQAAITRYIRNQGRILPTILFVNDLHWIDERSEAIVRDIARIREPTGVLILCTYRPEYEPRWPAGIAVEQIDLSPLPNSDAASLFQNCYGTSDEYAIDDIMLRAAGNPLFLEELAGHMRDPGSRKTTKPTNPADSGIPDTLAGLLLERVDAQSPTAQAIMRTASVAGRRFTAALVAGADDKDDDQSAFLQLLESGLIVQDGINQPIRYRFKHALVQDAIYNSLLAEDRESLHGIVGDRIEAAYPNRLVEFSEELSRHFEVAEQHVKAARYAHMAGAKSFDLFAIRDADLWYRKAIELFPPEADESDELLRAQAISNHIQISCWDARFNDMIALADQELSRVEALGDAREVSRTLSWLGEGHLNCSNFESAEQILTRALEIGERIDDLDSIGYALGELGWLRTITIGGDSLAQLAGQANRILNIAGNLDDHYLETLAHYILWIAHVHGGYIEKAQVWAERLIARGQVSGYPPALNWGYCMLSYCDVCNENLESAERHVNAARAVAQCAFDTLMTDLSLGIVKARQHDIPACRRLLGRSQRLGDQIGSLFFAYASEAEYGRILAADGEVDKAIEWLEDSRTFFAQAGHVRAAALSGLALGDVLLTIDDGRAQAVLADVSKDAARSGMKATNVEAILALNRSPAWRGDRQSALASLNQARQSARTLGWLSLEQRATRAYEAALAC
jgi:class 3 adenylate cyclase/SAM-dependent methyltransferase